MLIEIKTWMDYDSHRNHSRFIILRANTPAFITTLVVFVLFPLLLFMRGMMFSQGTFYYTFGLAGAFFLVVFTQNFFLEPKASYKRSQRLNPGEITFRFYENHVEYISVGLESNVFSAYQYTAFKYIYEVDSAFYLLSRSNTWLIIAKRYLNPGEVNYLHGLFANRFGENFKIR